LKIGIFYDSEDDTDLNYYLDTDYYGSTYDTSLEYRATYWNNDDDSMVELTPLSTNSEIIDASGTSSDYWIELPSTASEVGSWYPLAWLDEDEDDLLDLIDSSSDADQIASSEFSRCPVKDVDGTDVAIPYFYDDEEGGYKFTGQPGNYIRDLESDDNAGFDFDMNPDANGW
jgi:hypothetical protein